MVRLSKSRYVAGLQCEKRVYLETYQPELATEPDDATRAVLDMGTEVGALARRRFPGGRLIEAGYRQTQLALEQTAAAMADPTIPAVFEAAILADGVLIRVDILARVIDGEGKGDDEKAHEGAGETKADASAAASASANATGTAGDESAAPTDAAHGPELSTPTWRLIEVKSSTKKKDVHLDDVALQAHVLSCAGVRIVSCHLMYVNTQYIYAGVAQNGTDNIDVAKLFTIQDLTEELIERRTALPARLAAMQAVLQRPSAPVVEPDAHCQTPYECGFWDHCTKDKPPRWIYTLPGSRRQVPSWMAQGIVTIDELPPTARLTPIQSRVRANVEWCGPHLADVLRSVRYPVHHLDFETIMPAVPRYAGTHPYQVMPIQWSNHIERADGTLDHDEYLAEGTADPRRDLLDRLLASLGTSGSICVYSQYERSVLDSLAEAYPEWKAEVAAVKKRLWDLFEVLQAHYYHPDFHGSYSIKSVLPAVVPSLSYADLAIQGGAVAARQYIRMAFEEQDWVERQRIADELRAYCARDTYAMVALRRALLERAAVLKGGPQATG